MSIDVSAGGAFTLCARDPSRTASAQDDVGLKVLGKWRALLAWTAGRACFHLSLEG
jgi:hypothetical protein